MKAVVIHAYGGPEQLKFEECPDPIPGPGEVLVKVAATSVNPVDLKIRSGAVKDRVALTFPAILMTAFPLLPNDHPQLASRFTHVLTQPFDLQQLRQAVSSALATPIRPLPVIRRGPHTDPVEPGAEGGAALEPRKLSVDDEKDLLGHILEIGVADGTAL